MNLQEKKGFKGGIPLPERELVIFFGQNNCGKSSILYSINSTYGQQADYISPRRFDLSNDVVVTKNYDTEMVQAQNQRKEYNLNACELTAPDSIREIFTLSNNERDYITKWHNQYFGKLKIEKSKPDNDYSPPNVTIGGRKVFYDCKRTCKFPAQEKLFFKILSLQKILKRNRTTHDRTAI